MARVVLGIAGGIAAYKGPALVRALVKAGHEVQVVVTDAATAFVTELSLATVSKRPVRRTLLDAAHEQGDGGVGHIEIADWAQLVLVAPATADLCARMAAGMANDLLSTVLLATRAPVVLAPAMNTNMWRHPATRDNMRLLSERGCVFVGPDRGELACGWIGEGRMLDPDLIVEALPGFVTEHLGHEPTETEYSGVVASGADSDAVSPPPPSEPSGKGEGQDGQLNVELLLIGPRRLDELDAQDESLPEPKPGPWTGRRIIVTAGPTRAYIDPVRFISNASTGAMGFAIAEVARSLGAQVTLVSGPVERKTPDGVRRVDVETGAEMLEVLDAELSANHVDLVAMVAAIADLIPEEPAEEKLDKATMMESLGSMQWRKEVDVLATAVERYGANTRFLGFAAQTVGSDDPAEIEKTLLEAATEKLRRKGTDALFVNRVGVSGTGFASSTNGGYLLIGHGDGPPEVVHSGPPMPKAKLAAWMLGLIHQSMFPPTQAHG